MNHGFYDYNPGPLPSVSYAIKSEEGNRKRAEESLLLTGGTLAFKDGHVLEIGVPEK